MIKAVEKIPIRETRKPMSRTQAVRDDIRTAIDNRIPRFEFIGEIYCPNEIHTTFLNKSLVHDEGFRVLRRYFWPMLKTDKAWTIYEAYKMDDFFEVYRYPEPDHDRIFMEIYFEKIDRFIKKIEGVEA